MIYKKATAEVVLFDNTDILMGQNSGCKNNGQDNGHGCNNNNSGNCPDNQSWKGPQNSLSAWRESRAGL